MCQCSIYLLHDKLEMQKMTLLETGRKSCSRKFFGYELILADIKMNKFLLGNNVQNSWVIKKYNGIFAKPLPDCNFNQEICWLLPLPTSTRPTQRISNFFLYGGLLYDTIFCMWWWDWTIDLFYIFGPQTSSWCLSLTMQLRHCEYCAGRTYWCPHLHLP